MKSYVVIIILGLFSFMLVADSLPIELGGILAPVVTGVVIAIMGKSVFSITHRRLGLLAAIVGFLGPSTFIIRSYLYARPETLIMFSRLKIMAILPLLYHVIITVAIALTLSSIIEGLSSRTARAD